MFIYTTFSKNGFEPPEQLIESLLPYHPRCVCLIDEYGLAVPSFLDACLKHRLNVSFAFPFSCFFERFEERREGYFIASSPTGLEGIYRILEMIREQAIPFLSDEMLSFLSRREIACFLKTDELYEELFSSVRIPILPVAYSSEENKKLSSLYHGVESGIIPSSEASVPWLEQFSSPAFNFSRRCKSKFPSANIRDFIDWDDFSHRERSDLEQEIFFFEKKGLLSCFHLLHLARVHEIYYLAHGDLYRSMLAYALEIIPEKPSHYHQTFSHSEMFNLSIVISKEERSFLMNELSRDVPVFYPISKPNFDAKSSISLSGKFLGKRTERLLSKIRVSESLSDFSERMKIFLLLNEKERKLVDFSSSFSFAKQKKYTRFPDFLVFPGSPFFQYCPDGNVYIDPQNFNNLKIPFITCFSPPKEFQRLPLVYHQTESFSLDKNEISELYLELIYHS